MANPSLPLPGFGDDVPKVKPNVASSLVSYKVSDAACFYHTLADIGRLFDSEAPCYDVVWNASDTEVVRIVALRVEFQNVGVSTVYVRAQVPTAYPADAFRLGGWVNIQRPPKKRKRGKKKKRIARPESGGGPFTDSYVIVPPKRRVTRSFKGFGKNFCPRLMSFGDGDGKGATGWHVLSYALFEGTTADSGAVIKDQSVPGLVVSLNVTYVTDKDEIKHGVHIVSTLGYSRMDFIDPPPAVSMRVGDLVGNGGPIIYAYTVLTKSNKVQLQFVDKCKKSLTDPMGLDKSRLYASDLAVVDETQKTAYISAPLFNILGWSKDGDSGGWYLGALAMRGPRIEFAARTFASDPGRIVLPGQCMLRVYAADINSFPSKMQLSFSGTKYERHVRINAPVSSQGLAHSQLAHGSSVRGPVTILITAINVISVILEVLKSVQAIVDTVSPAHNVDRVRAVEKVRRRTADRGQASDSDDSLISASGFEDVSTIVPQTVALRL